MESSQQDQVGVNSEVASIVREFTEPVSEKVDNLYDEEASGDDVRFQFYHQFNSLIFFHEIQFSNLVLSIQFFSCPVKIYISVVFPAYW